MTIEAPDTAASLPGTASYFNRKANKGLEDCPCTGIPDGQHIPPCPHNNTPEAPECPYCKGRPVWAFGVCGLCGFIQPERNLMYAAKVLADSVSELGHRLMTVEVTFPRFILAEVNTHRMLSRNSASSRAIPPERIIEAVLEQPFVPETFNSRVKGMGVGEALTGEKADICRLSWLDSRDAAVIAAQAIIMQDADKSRINRLLEPFMWHTAIITATDWENFFALRCPPGEELDFTFPAQPEFQLTALAMREAMRASEPRLLTQHDWHLPLVLDAERPDPLSASETELERAAMCSAGRCARVSFDKHHDYEQPATSIERAERLKRSGHLSPFEHPAKPMNIGNEYCGNFKGWLQLRKLIPYEENLVGSLEGRPAWEAV